MSEVIQNMYRESTSSVRASFGADQARALEYYSKLCQFIQGVASPLGHFGTQLLDVGCGNGWSTYAFSNLGYDATGIDLNPNAFEAVTSEHCRLAYGSATKIPFDPDSFDVVVCHQCLEHVPDPCLSLQEMARVCRPGGLIVIVGPNLVSPVTGLMYVARPSSWKSLHVFRRAGMPNHPYGNTLPEVLGTAVVRTVQLLGKLLRRTPHFSMREPDTVPPFHADNDACYLCNPTDLIHHFHSQGFYVECRGKPGRLPLSYLFAGGTWIVARKPK
ncbi:MAG: class I SAM-dependent methyltransferase [Fimbriiglobus sp.]